VVNGHCYAKGEVHRGLYGKNGIPQLKMISRGVVSRHWRDSGQGRGHREEIFDFAILASWRECFLSSGQIESGMVKMIH